MKKIIFIKKVLFQVTIVAGILLIASCGQNQRQRDTRDVAEDRNKERFDDNKQKKDAQFLVDAAENNLKQIRLGQLAQQRATTTHVQELGKMLEDAHTKSQRDLTALAGRKSIIIPTSPTDDVQDAYRNLNNKSGNDFDKEYVDEMVSKHKDAIKTFEDATTDGYDTDIKNWAIASLPDMRTHLNHTIETQKITDELKSR